MCFKEESQEGVEVVIVIAHDDQINGGANGGWLEVAWRVLRGVRVPGNFRVGG